MIRWKGNGILELSRKSGRRPELAELVKKTPYHVLLFAIAPILVLLSHNIDQVRATVAVRAVFISVIVTILFLLLLWLLFRQWDLAGVTTTLALLLMFSYGHIYNWIRSSGSLGLLLGRQRYLLPLWLVLLIIGIRLAYGRRENLRSATLALNVFGWVFLLLPLFQIASYSLQARMSWSRTPTNPAQEPALQIPTGEQPRDIYYFILDAYTRADILRDVIGYDNTPFLNALSEKGFYIAPCSQSNYAQTNLSLASTFNMDYIQRFGTSSDPQGSSISLPRLIQENAVRRMLEEIGYTIVAFETGFYATQWMDADIYLSPPKDEPYTAFIRLTTMNEFEALLLSNTALWGILDVIDAPDVLARAFPVVDAPRSAYRDRTLFVLEQFEPDKVPALQGPKFVYAHLILPHSPYVFDRNGEWVGEDKDDFDKEAYRDQLHYANQRMMEILHVLLMDLNNPPVIIIQGDHGFHFVPEERMGILNAMYLPDDREQGLYPTFSPVNTFRVIFNRYFGGRFNLLDDKSYFSGYDAPFEFEAVPPLTTDCMRE